MRTLRGRFILSHILPILLIVPLVGIGLVYALETQVLLTGLSEDLSDKANLIARSVYAQPDLWQNPDQAKAFVTSISVHLNGYVILLLPDGRLLATSDPGLQDQGGQPVELQDMTALQGGQQNVLIHYGLVRQEARVLVPVTNVDQQLVGIIGVTESLESLASRFGRLRTVVLGILGIELLVGAALAVLMARRLERPIHDVVTAVTDIAEGRRVEPIPLEGPQEIRRLSESVNMLAEQLRTLEETRRRLLANIVHELGRPLGAVRAAIHVLRRGAGDDPDVRAELLAGMEDELERMQPLLDDLAQIHGQVPTSVQLDRQPVALGEWLGSVVLPWRAAALEKGLGWQADLPSNLPSVELDRDRMARAIGNLLSNAVKYTPAGGTVLVSAGAQEDEAWIRVHDTGPGIALEEQERIFEPFYRSQKLRRFPQGLGLGLTIALDLVRAHGGRLELSSAPDQGSTFTIYLPLSADN